MSVNNSFQSQSEKYGDFLGNQVLNFTPISFTVEFITRMRKNHILIQNIPSSRQAVAIPKLLTAIYYRKNNLIPEDFIKAAVLTTPIEDQIIAKKIAFEILFPTPFLNPKSVAHSAQKPQLFINPGTPNPTDFMEDFLSDLSDAGVDLDEINNPDILDQNFKEFDDIMKFAEDLYSRASLQEEPYASLVKILDQRNGFTGLMIKGIKDLNSLKSYSHQIIKSELNSLLPSDISASNNLGWIKEIQEQSRVPWVKTGSYYCGQHPDYLKELSQLFKEGDVGTLTKTIKFLKDLGEKDEKIENLTNKIMKNAKTLSQISEISKILEKIPNFDQNKIFKNSLAQNLNQSFKNSRYLDKKFKTSISEDLFDYWDKSNVNPSLSDLFHAQSENKNWQIKWNQSLQKSLDHISQNYSTSSTTRYQELTQTLMQYSNQAIFQNCKTEFENAAQKVAMTNLKQINNPTEFLSSLKNYLSLKTPLENKSLTKLAFDNKISSETLEEILGGSYQLLLNMIQNEIGNFKRYFKIIKGLKSLSPNQMQEIMENASNFNNSDAFAAIGHYNMGNALKTAKKMGDSSLNQLAYSLGAGPGDNLLLQWFKHRHNIPSSVKSIIRNLTKRTLVKIALDFLSKQRGSGEKGLIPTNRLRIFLDGDDMDSVNIDASIENIIMQGKSLDLLRIDDLLVNDTQRGRVSICFLLDISGSMSGEKLAACSIATIVLIGKLKAEEVAIALFESNTHVLKKIDENKDLDFIADELLDLKARGGTRVDAALKWGSNQLLESDSEMKICLLLTDCMFSENEKVIKKDLEPYVNNKVKFILAVNTNSYQKKYADLILNQTKGEFIKILNIKDIPKIISEVLEKI